VNLAFYWHGSFLQAGGSILNLLDTFAQCSLGHHQNMTGEMRAPRVQCALKPIPRPQVSLLHLFAAVVWQPAFAAATRALPPNRDVTLPSARPPHLTAAHAISATKASMHLHSSLSQLLTDTSANKAAHMNWSWPQRPPRDDESTDHAPLEVTPQLHHQNVNHRAAHNASTNRSFAGEPGFVVAIRDANSSSHRQEQRRSGIGNWQTQPRSQPAPASASAEIPDASGKTWLGLPKFMWAVFLTVIAMLIFIACIPFILTIAKRRRQPSHS